MKRNEKTKVKNKVLRDAKTGRFIQQEKDKNGTLLITAVGGAILGNIILPGIGGAIVGGLIGSAIGASSNKGDNDE